MRMREICIRVIQDNVVFYLIYLFTGFFRISQLCIWMARINFVLLMVTACSTSMAAGDTGDLVENVDADSPLENLCDVLESRADKAGNVGSLNGLSIATQSDTIFPGAPVQGNINPGKIEAIKAMLTPRCKGQLFRPTRYKI